MSFDGKLPEYVHRIDKDGEFQFSCHKDVPCFTECCRMLELALTPYDALRLRIGTGQNSRELLDNYLIVEQDPGEPFPRVYLTMVDDGRASCIFVNKDGCRIYNHRPSACRTYPMGRAIIRENTSDLQEHFVLIKEKHCKGFTEKTPLTPILYTEDQQLERYNHFNDAVSVILQHEAIRKGLIPTKKQVELFLLALYDIDSFREKLLAGQLSGTELTEEEKQSLTDDEKLLQFGIDWLHRQIYSSFR